MRDFFRQAMIYAVYNFRRWHKNPRIIIAFFLTFIVCFLLTDRLLDYSYGYGTTLQIFEPFIWTFGDSNSILLMSLFTLILFADMPFLTSGLPFFLMRSSKKSWLAGQIIYIFGTCLIYMLFILLSTIFLCCQNAFAGNIWSKTAAILGYSGDGELLSVPVTVKTLEMSRPYTCALTVFALMLIYMLVIVFVMFLFSIVKGRRAGTVSVLAFSLYGFLLNPKNIINFLSLPQQLFYKAWVFTGWVSPLNQATYSMHNFGYDRLPRLWQSYAIFALILIFLIALSYRAMRGYNYDFCGGQNGG